MTDIKDKCLKLSERQEVIAKHFETLPVPLYGHANACRMAEAILQALPDLLAIYERLGHLSAVVYDNGGVKPELAEEFCSAVLRAREAYCKIFSGICDELPSNAVPLPISPAPHKVSIKALSELFWSEAIIDEDGNLCGEDAALEAVAKACGCVPEEGEE